MKLYVYVVAGFILVLAFLSMGCPPDFETTDASNIASDVQKGMTTSDVIRLVGEPTAEGQDPRGGVVYYYTDHSEEFTVAVYISDNRVTKVQTITSN